LAKRGTVYKREKRKKELSRQKKQDEKRQKRLRNEKATDPENKAAEPME
jgi:hypothetical protein